MKDAEQARSDRVVHASNWLPAKKVLISPQWERKGTMSLLGNDKTATRPIRMKKVVMLAVAILAATVGHRPGGQRQGQLADDIAPCVMAKRARGTHRPEERTARRTIGTPKCRLPSPTKRLLEPSRTGCRKDGRMKMKSFGGELTDQDIRDLAQYSRSFKKGSYRPGLVGL